MQAKTLRMPAGPDVAAQTRRILESLSDDAGSVGSGSDHVVHVDVFPAGMADFESLNDAYVETMGGQRTADRRTSAVDVLRLLDEAFAVHAMSSEGERTTLPP
jgi:enamine deaminase RidA (YjgF/YER057c/UK114 family)